MAPHESIPGGAVRAPAAHRAVAALASPLLGYFVARLLLRYTMLPSALTYAVCLLLGVALGWRAWSSRIDLGTTTLRVHNTLATTTLDRGDIRRIGETGRVEWYAGGRRPVRLPSEALRGSWWTFGTGAGSYALNRERVRSWHRVPPADRNPRPAAGVEADTETSGQESGG